MCVLIAVNQLGSAAVVPVIALYARRSVSRSRRSASPSPSTASRVSSSAPAGQLGDRLGRRTALAAGRARHRRRATCSRLRPDLRRVRRRALRGGRGAAWWSTTGQIVLADITTPARRGPRHGHPPGRLPFAVGIGPRAGRAPRGTLRPPGAVRRLRAARASVVPRSRGSSSPTRGASLAASIGLGTARAAAGPLPARPPPHWAPRLRLSSAPLGFVNAVARTGAPFNVIPLSRGDRLALSRRPHRARPRAGEHRRPRAGLSGGRCSPTATGARR